MSAPLIYAYVRFSSPAQAEGDSYRRQIQLAEAYASERGMVLDDKLVIADLAKSAFRGANVSAEAGLGKFIEAVDHGLVPKGSVLVVEALDRLSRREPIEASHQLTGLILKGVSIYTTSDRHLYDRARTAGDPAALIIALVKISAAHEESAKKSARLKAVWAERRRRVAAGEQQVLTSNGPSWLRREGDGWAIIPEKAEAVRRVFLLATEGKGALATVRVLNAEGVEPLGRGKQWYRGSIHQILDNPAVIGTLVPAVMSYSDEGKQRVKQEPVLNAYPAIIDKELWSTVRAIRDGSTRAVRGRGATAPLANVFAGLARCLQCDGNMMRHTRSEGRPPVLVCVKGKSKAGCTTRTVALPVLEAALQSSWPALMDSVPAGDAGGSLDVTCRDLQGAIWATEDKLQSMADDYGRQPSSILAAKLQATEAELASLRVSLDEAEERRASTDGGLIHARLGRLQDLLEAEDVERAPVNAALRSLFSRITVDHAAGLLRFAWKQGGESAIVYAMPDASREVEAMSHAA